MITINAYNASDFTFNGKMKKTLFEYSAWVYEATKRGFEVFDSGSYFTLRDLTGKARCYFTVEKEQA